MSSKGSNLLSFSGQPNHGRAAAFLLDILQHSSIHTKYAIHLRPSETTIPFQYLCLLIQFNGSNIKSNCRHVCLFKMFTYFLATCIVHIYSYESNTEHYHHLRKGQGMNSKLLTDCELSTRCRWRGESDRQRVWYDDPLFGHLTTDTQHSTTKTNLRYPLHYTQKVQSFRFCPFVSLSGAPTMDLPLSHGSRKKE